MPKLSHPQHRPCRVCGQRLTPAGQGDTTGMPCRPCLVNIFEDMRQARLLDEAQQPPKPSTGYVYPLARRA